MKRVKFEKGEQRKFIENIMQETGCPSLRALNQFGFDIPYSTLKNYFTEKRLLPENFFRDLCVLGKIDVNELNVEFLDENWGKVLGGKS